MFFTCRLALKTPPVSNSNLSKTTSAAHPLRRTPARSVTNPRPQRNTVHVTMNHRTWNHTASLPLRPQEVTASSTASTRKCARTPWWPGWRRAGCPRPPPARPWRTSTPTRRLGCCPSSTWATAGTRPTSPGSRTWGPRACWTWPRSCPGTTRSAASPTSRYRHPTPDTRIWSSISRKPSNLLVSGDCVFWLGRFLAVCRVSALSASILGIRAVLIWE